MTNLGHIKETRIKLFGAKFGGMDLFWVGFFFFF